MRISGWRRARAIWDKPKGANALVVVMVVVKVRISGRNDTGTACACCMEYNSYWRGHDYYKSRRS